MKQNYPVWLKKITRFIAGFVFLLCAVKGQAQDFHLSQYDASPLFLNPSMTGMFDGKYRVHLHYRSQWATVSTKPFTTAGLTLDMPLKKLGVGIQVMNFRAGAGNYNELSALLSLSYDLASKTNMHHLAVGIQAGILHKTVSGDKLIFGNQYDAINGGGFNSSLPSGEVFKNTNYTIPAINAGLLYYFAKSNARLNPFFGLSAFNLTQPKQAFLENDVPLPMRIYFHGGIKINVNERIQLLPKFIYMRQLENKELTTSLMLYYYLKDANTFLMLGPSFRLKDATILEAGIKRGDYTLRVSYDINTSPLKTVTYYKGGFEISLTYQVGKPKVNPDVNCPRL
ncbi:MAG TPA: PorP/SprF family type IX secretion system membrane protein [Bacteroidia bacterium]|jgi:type IX secretion system PorP/SprF family membrane protein|nr:PorP/SprF family type IX secretion system membrane protein [Bacteroidia bacterium]